MAGLMAVTRIACRTPLPGRQGATHLPEWKFDVLRAAILTSIGPDGIAFKDLPTAVGARLTVRDKARLGSLGWHVTTVKQELEVRGEIAGAQGAGPERLVLKHPQP